MTISIISSAQNPFGLVYENAIRENIQGEVSIHPVTYKLNGIDIAANVYIPAGYDSSKKYPAVVVAHPNGGIKEQVSGLYAQHLAEAGYITISACQRGLKYWMLSTGMARCSRVNSNIWPSLLNQTKEQLFGCNPLPMNNITVMVNSTY